MQQTFSPPDNISPSIPCFLFFFGLHSSICHLYQWVCICIVFPLCACCASLLNYESCMHAYLHMINVKHAIKTLMCTSYPCLEHQSFRSSLQRWLLHKDWLDNTEGTVEDGGISKRREQRCRLSKANLSLDLDVGTFLIFPNEICS